MLRDNWAFALLVLFAVAASLYAVRNPRASEIATPKGTLDFFRVFCVVSLCIMLPLPILSCGWKDANNVRYLFNWLVLPGFLLTLEFAVRWHVSQRSLIGAGAVFAVFFAGATLGLRHDTFALPYPNDVAALDALLQRRGLHYGLAQYWEAKNVTALSHAGAELRQVRPDGTPYFWDNNALAYYERTGPSALSWPAYQYILANHLDEGILTRVFGEPQAKETAGAFQVWIYGEESQRRIRETLEPAVREKLGPKRLAGFDVN